MEGYIPKRKFSPPHASKKFLWKEIFGINSFLKELKTFKNNCKLKAFLCVWISIFLHGFLLLWIFLNVMFLCAWYFFHFNYSFGNYFSLLKKFHLRSNLSIFCACGVHRINKKTKIVLCNFFVHKDFFFLNKIFFPFLKGPTKNLIYSFFKCSH